MPTFNVTVYYHCSTSVQVEAETAAEAYAEACEQASAENFDDVSEDGYGIFLIDDSGNVAGEWHDDENPFDGESDEESESE